MQQPQRFLLTHSEENKPTPPSLRLDPLFPTCARLLWWLSRHVVRFQSILVEVPFVHLAPPSMSLAGICGGHSLSMRAVKQKQCRGLGKPGNTLHHASTLLGPLVADWAGVFLAHIHPSSSPKFQKHPQRRICWTTQLVMQCWKHGSWCPPTLKDGAHVVVFLQNIS